MVEEKNEKVAVQAESKEQPQTHRSLLFRSLRASRLSLESGGLIGRVLESRIYRSLANVRAILFVLEPLLWIIEHYFGIYTMNPIDRMMKHMFKEKHSYGVIGQALGSQAAEVLRKVVGISFGVEGCLGLLHWVLEMFTLEEWEVAKREFDEARVRLGDGAEEEDEGNDKGGLLSALVDNRVFSVAQYLAVAWYVGVFVLRLVGEVGEEIADTRDSRPDITPEDLAAFNPWRDIQPSHNAVLREVIYIDHVLRDLTPTTLPGDDYQLYSDMIRSLETRNDIPWRIFEEVNIQQTFTAATNRGGSRRNPIADEPFNIQERVGALHTHWYQLSLASDKPERWQDASDTTCLAPLLTTSSLEKDRAGQHEPFKLTLSPEQDAEATQIYTSWRKNRDRKVSYLKVHPPTPMAWVPSAKSDAGIHAAWDSVFDDGKVRAGRKVSTGKLANGKLWKPIYRSLLTERIPFGWTPPGELEGDYEAAVGEELAVMQARSEERMRRSERQSKYLEELRAGKEEL